MNELTLTVRDVLERKSFQSATVIAGFEGLDRHVKWSHVLEINDVSSFINGGELILTTGIGLQHDPSAQLKFLHKLIERNVAGICIEMGTFFKEIPQAFLDLGNQHQFPIIIFEETVKFVDITQDLHTFIINRHHDMLSKLDTLSRKFNELSLMPNGILKILHELHHFFHQQVLFLAEEGKSYYYPVEAKQFQEEIEDYFANHPLEKASNNHFSIRQQLFISIPVKVLGQNWGCLCLQAELPHSDELSFLILDRAALAIAQILLRNRTLEERKQHHEEEFVRNLLNGRHVEENDYQVFLPTNSRNLHFRIMTIQVNDQEAPIDTHDWEEVKLQRSLFIRSLFKRNGFFPAVSVTKNEMTVIASFIAADHLVQEKTRFLDVCDQVKNLTDNNYVSGKNCMFGISDVHHSFSNIQKGYQEAKTVIQLFDADVIQSYFYEDLGIYRLLLLIEDRTQLRQYTEHHLSAVLAYDERTNSHLFDTLLTYLEVGGSKKEAAEKLFIVRQTLYHRLEKLESLLGEDFMSPTNRLALEAAVRAHVLIQRTDFSHGS